MQTRGIRLIAFALVLGAVVCVGVMFAGGLGMMLELGRAGNVRFADFVARIRELRVWGLVGIGLFLVAAVLLWFIPSGRGEDQSSQSQAQRRDRT